MPQKKSKKVWKSHYVSITRKLGLKEYLERCVDSAINTVKRDLRYEVLDEASRLVYQLREDEWREKKLEWENKWLVQNIEFELGEIITERLSKLSQMPLHDPEPEPEEKPE
tara:strand:- start:605 stop:937 length:333 start_codon:yes stop_codon:yes gene_type:complete